MFQSFIGYYLDPFYLLSISQCFPSTYSLLLSCILIIIQIKCTFLDKVFKLFKRRKKMEEINVVINVIYHLKPCWASTFDYVLIKEDFQCICLSTFAYWIQRNCHIWLYRTYPSHWPCKKWQNFGLVQIYCICVRIENTVEKWRKCWLQEHCLSSLHQGCQNTGSFGMYGGIFLPWHTRSLSW